MLNNTVRIGSEEFKNAVLDVVKKYNLIINDIEDHRFQRLSDGWIKDLELDIEWGPSSSEGMVFSKAQEYCKSLGGRLPTVDELFSLVDRNIDNPCVNKKTFKDMKSEYYWTSEITSWNKNARWVVGFNYGNVCYNYESDYSYVRPVRPSQC